ncbi:DNA/RNA-binding protein Alba [Candidatus Gugararchaeum adminiculabundum]|nr:DNA/RNA-binding protein Alba [Candidatus Gugararchaeum adminiculabundum]
MEEESEIAEINAEATALAEKPQRTARDPNDNTIYVGKKSAMSYVLAVVTQFNNGAKEVSIKARGKVISRAVDVAEIVKSRFIADLKIKAINISTEELLSEDGSMNKVSAMEIVLLR